MHDVCQKGDMGWMWKSNPIFRGKEDPSSLDVAVAAIKAGDSTGQVTPFGRELQAKSKLESLVHEA